MNPKIKACLEASKALSAALDQRLKPIPEGWFSCKEFAESMGLKGTQAGKKLLDGYRLGVFERKPWKFKRGPAPIYRLKR